MRKIGARTRLALVSALLVVLVAGVLLSTLTAVPSGQAPEAAVAPGDAAAQAAVAKAYGEMPLSFEANRGQADEQVRFLARASGYTLFLTPAEAVLARRQRPLPAQRQTWIALAPQRQLRLRCSACGWWGATRRQR